MVTPDLPALTCQQTELCCESDHNMAVAKSAIVAVSTRSRCGPRPTAVAPASSIILTSFSVKSGDTPKIN